MDGLWSCCPGAAGMCTVPCAPEPQHLPYRAVPQLSPPQPVLLPGVMDFAFVPTKFDEVPVGLFLQPIVASVNGSPDSQMGFPFPTPT